MNDKNDLECCKKIIQSVDMMKWSLVTVHFVLSHQPWMDFLRSAVRSMLKVFFLFVTVSLLLVLLVNFIMHIFVNMAVGCQYVVVTVNMSRSTDE